MFRIIATSLFLIFLSHTLLARGYPRMERLTTEHGLSQNMVYGLYQDSKGFLWFGTRDGLNRYDGYRFLVFRHDPFDTTSLPWTSVTNITEDTEGNIWFSSYGGLGMLDRRTFRFIKVNYGLGNAPIIALQGDRAGNVWAGTEKGLVRCVGRSGRVTHFPADSSNPAKLFSDSIGALYQDHAGALWIGTRGRYLHRYDPERGCFIRYDSKLPGIQAAYCLGEDRKGSLYATYQSNFGNAIVQVDRRRGVVLQRGGRLDRIPRVDGESGVPVCLDTLGGIWIMHIRWVKGGQRRRTRLWRVSLQNGEEGPVFDTPGPRPLGDNIWSMICDRSGTVWVGTENGVVKLVLQEPSFHTHRNIPGDTASLSHNRVRGIYEDDDGSLWVGTDNGLNRFDRKNRYWVRHAIDWRAPNDNVSQTVNTIVKDSDGTLLLGTNVGYGVYDRKRNTYSYRDGAGIPGILGYQVWSFLRDSSGLLWVGTRVDGIFLYDRKWRRVRHIQPRPNDSTTIAPGIIWDMHCDRYGIIWIATGTGLYRWVPERGIFRKCGVYPAVPNGLSNSNVCDIMEDSSGVLWFSTYGGGVNRYDRSSDTFTHISTRQGLPGNAVYGALMDGSGKLWICSNTGLVTYDPATGASRVYNAGDGLQSNEFSFKAFLRMRNGEMVFGGINGLTIFHPDSLPQRRNEAPIVVTGFRVFDKVVRSEVRTGDTIEVKYDETFISFEFAMLDYVNPGGIRYAYQLAGFDNDWVDCGDRRYASFTNLDPGTYTFMVKGTNGDGAWSPRPLLITLRVVPPFWMTLWFKTLAGAVVLLAAAGGTMLRVRSVKGKEILRRRSVESQLQALRLQVNPHFIFNALSSIQHLILVTERERAVEYLSRFARLVRSVLENSERTSIPLAEELANLHNYLHLEMFRFEGKFRYTIDVDPELDLQHVSIPTMLIQPYVENAIRHGLYHKAGEGRLTILIGRRGESIHCAIEDDGVGRSRAGELRGVNGHGGKSMGIRVTEERLNILNAASAGREAISMEIVDLSDEKGAPAGTRVELFIPAEFI